MTTAEKNCPVCNKTLVAHIPRPEKSIVWDEPKENDLTVCAFCAQMLRFDNNIRLAVLTTDEFKALDQETQEQLNNTVYLIVNMHK